ncbi:phage tail-collar fiber domain-containing protein [Phytobacter sp. V91]|uniref:phage tail-collar fiber domain-containing protein n=1 Tax=Phytobacter sp. V91 TaxID=3369425 RepID=UPI003F61C82A
MASKYYALLTERGAVKLAAATALGNQVKITHMAVGDGNGALPTPTASQTALVNEKRRAALNSLTIDPANPSQIIAEQVIPEGDGGFWIREIGVYDDDGELIAVSNSPETYKPILAEGSGRTQVIRMVLIVSSTDAVTLKIDPSVVLATRKYVDDRVIEVKAYADDLMAKHLAALDPHPQYAPKASPTLTGQPKAPTPPTNNNSTQLATTAFVQAVIAQLVASSPAALDTLNELAAALGNDPNFATTITNALALKAPLASPALTGVPTAPTAGATINTTQVATTAFVQAVITALKAGAPTTLDTLDELAAAINDDPNFATTVNGYLALKAPLASPTLTGIPTAPTAGATVNTTQIATTAFVQAAIAQLVASSPAALDTLNELAAAINDDPNFATTITNALALKAPLASPALTGTPTAPTAAAATNNTQVATTAFVQAVITALKGGAPTTLDTLNELAAALGNDPNFATTITNLLALKAPLANPRFAGSVTVEGALTVLGGGSFNATLALRYRQLFQRDGAIGYQSFSRADVLSAPSVDTEIGRQLFGYGITSTDSWGTGGILAYMNAIALANGGGKLQLVAHDAQARGKAVIVLDGNAGAINFTGDANFSGTVTFGGMIVANRHDSCIAFSSSDATKPIINANYSAAGNFGFWDDTNSTWVLRKDVANNWYMYAGLTVAQKLTVQGGAAFTGDVTAPTPPKTDSSTKVATTEFVQNLSVPVGVPVPWPSATPPSGWLKCNGAAFSATSYPELAKIYTTLKVPDLRGEFIRGWDDGKGVDSSRALLSSQTDGIGIYQATNLTAVKMIFVSGGRTEAYPSTDALNGVADGGAFSDGLSSSISRATFKSATETRPRNIAFNYIVRAA